jgi:hypothetical protein
MPKEWQIQQANRSTVAKLEDSLLCWRIWEVILISTWVLDWDLLTSEQQAEESMQFKTLKFLNLFNITMNPELRLKIILRKFATNLWASNHQMAQSSTPQTTENLINLDLHRCIHYLIILLKTHIQEMVIVSITTESWVRILTFLSNSQANTLWTTRWTRRSCSKR